MFDAALHGLCCVLTCLAASVTSQAPVSPLRAPAEFEPVQGVVLRWAPAIDDALYGELVGHIQAANATAYIVVASESQQREAEEYMRKEGVPSQDAVFIVQPTDSIWVRDYGAVPFYQGYDARLAFADFLYKPATRPMDDVACYEIWDDFASRIYQVGDGSQPLALEGGDFLTDGFGTVFTSVSVADWSPKGGQVVSECLEDFLAVGACHFLPHPSSFDQTHIDMHVKLVDEETFLVGEPVVGPLDAELEDTVQYLASLETCYGGPYRIFRIPMAPSRDFSSGAQDVLTYTNALIVNNHVLIPAYGSSYDDQALAVYEEAMPGYHCHQLDCSRIIYRGGALHCMTREVPFQKAVRIEHPRFTEPFFVGEAIPFYASCWSQEVVETMTLYVQMPGESTFTPYPMEEEGGLFSASVPVSAAGEIRYYIRALASGLVGYKPQNAYDGGYLTVQARRRG